MVHLLNPLLQGGHLPIGHILQNQQGEGPLVEIRQQLVLAHHRVHVLRQIVQHVVVDPGSRHSHYRGDHQRQHGDENGNAELHNRFGKTHWESVILSS